MFRETPIIILGVVVTLSREPFDEVRGRLLAIRQDPEWTPPAARFSIGPGVLVMLAQGRLTTERQLLEAVVGFCYPKKAGASDAEADPTPNPLLEQLRLARKQPESEAAKAKRLHDIALAASLPGSGASIESAHAMELERENAERIQYLSLFAHVVADRSGASNRFLSTAQDILITQAWSLPAFDAKTNEMYPHLVLNSSSALWAFVAVLLLTPNWEFGDCPHKWQ